MWEDPISTFSDMGRIIGKRLMLIMLFRGRYLYFPGGLLGTGGLGSVS